MVFMRRCSQNLPAFFSACAIGLLGLVSPVALADMQLNLTQGVTPVSHAQYNLHMMIFWICVAIGIVVFSVMFYAIIRHRKSRGAKSAQFHENTTVEIIWAVVPLLILMVMAVPATKALILIDDTENADINIKVTGYQWKWQYDYMDEDIQYFSNLSTSQDQIANLAPKDAHYLLEVDHPLVVPINKKIRFLVTATDVIHSWWVPALGVKRDAVPGFIHESWATIEKPGTYRGQCAELCGVGHGFMPIVVVAKTQEDYEAWLNQQKDKKDQEKAAASKTWTDTELMDLGEKTYNKTCSVCHQTNGQGMPPTFPALKGSLIATGPVEKHMDIVLHGKSGTAMQAFANQLSDVELAAVITYERNAWGNDTNDIIQPSDIAVAKGQQAPAPDSAEAQIKEVTVDVDKTYTKDALMTMGEEKYLQFCSVCHQANGAGMPPTFPALSTSPYVNGPAADHIRRVLNGVPGTAMQPFKQQLNPVDIAAIVTYERNAWNGGKGDVVQPKDIVNQLNNDDKQQSVSQGDPQ